MHMVYIYRMMTLLAEDFWFGNFHENLATMTEGNALWEATGGDAKA